MSKETLADKISYQRWDKPIETNGKNFEMIGFIEVKHVKEKIQNAQRRLEDWIIHNKGCYQLGFEVVKTRELFREIDKIFLEEFGGKLIKDGK